MRRAESYLPIVGKVEWTVLGVTRAVRKLVAPSVWVGLRGKYHEVTILLGEPWWRRWCWWLAKGDKRRVENVLEYSRPAQVKLDVEVQPK